MLISDWYDDLMKSEQRHYGNNFAISCCKLGRLYDLVHDRISCRISTFKDKNKSF